MAQPLFHIDQPWIKARTSDLRDACRTDGGCRGGDGDGDDGPEGDVHLAHLRDEDGGHSLVERSPVHVDGGADGEHEPEKTEGKYE